jgi:hypothetical protein
MLPEHHDPPAVPLEPQVIQRAVTLVVANYAEPRRMTLA